MLADMIATERTCFTVIMVIQQHMAVWAEVFVGGNTGSTDVEKAHLILLPYGLREQPGS